MFVMRLAFSFIIVIIVVILLLYLKTYVMGI